MKMLIYSPNNSPLKSFHDHKYKQQQQQKNFHDQAEPLELAFGQESAISPGCYAPE